MHPHRHQHLHFHKRSVLALFVIVNLVPLAAIGAQHFLGPSPAAALAELGKGFFGQGAFLGLWVFILIANIVVFAVTMPIFAVLKRFDLGKAPDECLLARAIAALNRVEPTVYILNLCGFVVGTVVELAFFADGPVAPRGALWDIVEAAATAMMSAAVMSLQLDRVFFPIRRRVLTYRPAEQLKYSSTQARIFVSVLSLIFFATTQGLASITIFTELASLPGRPAFGGFLSPREFLEVAGPLRGMDSALGVLGIRALLTILFAAEVLALLRTKILVPIRAIEYSVDALLDEREATLQTIDIVNNDEYRPLFEKINRLVVRQQQQIESGERRLAAIIEGAGDAILSFDSEGTLVLANQAAIDLFGITRAATPGAGIVHSDGTRVLIGDLIAPTEADRQDNETLLAFLGRNDPGVSRLVGKLADGTTIPIEVNYSRIEVENRRQDTVVVRDVRKRAEMEERLEQAREAAERANAMKSEFLANMSHELRTPLNAVLGFAQLLSRDATTTDSQRQKLSIISRSGEHLLGLINDILDISKIEAGRFEVEESPFDLRSLTEDLSDMFALRAQNKGLALDVEILEDTPRYVVGDLGKLRQVLINLLGNAVKFTDQGGISLVVGPDGDQIRFAVRDTGRGIPAGEVDRLLEPFTQATSTDHESGTGLGLAISSRFVGLMGGKLQIETEVGVGSTFTFALELPSTNATPGEPIGRRSHARVREGVHPRALVVDDKRDNRLVIKEVLDPAGFVVMEAENGREAVERAKTFAPDVIFMDIRMPVMDGYAATAALRTDEQTRNTPVIALTASAFRHDEDRMLRSGFDGFLAKPFQVDRVLELIERTTTIRFEDDSEQQDDADSSMRTSDDEFDFASARSALPAGFLDQLADAILINDFSAAERLGLSISDGDSAPLGRLIRRLADAYDEAGLEDVVARLRQPA